VAGLRLLAWAGRCGVRNGSGRLTEAAARGWVPVPPAATAAAWVGIAGPVPGLVDGALDLVREFVQEFAHSVDTSSRKVWTWMGRRRQET